MPYASLGVAAVTVTPALADASTARCSTARSCAVLAGRRRSARRFRAGVQTAQVAGDTYPRDGDIIVAVGATPVAGFRDLDRAVAAHRAGDRVVLHVVRRDGKHVVAVRLLPRPRELRQLRLTALRAAGPGIRLRADAATGRTKEDVWRAISARGRVDGRPDPDRRCAQRQS